MKSSFQKYNFKQLMLHLKNTRMSQSLHKNIQLHTIETSELTIARTKQIEKAISEKALRTRNKCFYDFPKHEI